MEAKDTRASPMAVGISDADEEYRLFNDVVHSITSAPLPFLLSSRDCAYDLVVLIFELPKKDVMLMGFSLKVSVPPFILENENSIRLLLKKMYSSEVLFNEMLESDTMSITDAFKDVYYKTLETLLAEACSLVIN